MSIRLLLHFLFITRGTICKWREGKRREAGYGFGGFKLNSTPRFGATATRPPLPRGSTWNFKLEIFYFLVEPRHFSVRHR
jgi:hypothetical protein